MTHVPTPKQRKALFWHGLGSSVHGETWRPQNSGWLHRFVFMSFRVIRLLLLLLWKCSTWTQQQMLLEYHKFDAVHRVWREEYRKQEVSSTFGRRTSNKPSKLRTRQESPCHNATWSRFLRSGVRIASAQQIHHCPVMNLTASWTQRYLSPWLTGPCNNGKGEDGGRPSLALPRWWNCWNWHQRFFWKWVAPSSTGTSDFL